jgi:methionine aminotransferase
VNSPHNPTGSLLSENDIKELEKITSGTDILVVSDEVYEHIVFDDKKHISLSESEELAGRSFVISSFGKTYHTTGWKMGFCAAPEYLTDEFRKMHQFIVFSSNTPIQYAYADYMQREDKYLSLSSFYEKKRNLFAAKIQNLSADIQHLRKTSGQGPKFEILDCRGTYFQLLDYSKISDLPDMKFAEYMTKEVGVAVIPLSPFYEKQESKPIVRVCFAKTDKVLMKAAEKITALQKAH